MNNKTISIIPGGENMVVVIATTKAKNKSMDSMHRSILKKEF